MKKFNKTVNEIIDGEKCPLPLEVIPNKMGINLVSVRSISWSEFDDGQINELTIHFIPTVNSMAQADIIANDGKVLATYKFPNGNVATFGYDDKQIPELQGVYTPELYDKIKKRSDNRTSWNGF